MSETKDYGPAVLRIGLGLLFFIPGIQKLMMPGMIIGMLGSMSVPAAALMGWILIISEILFGALLIVGYKVKYAVWPLAAVLLVAVLMVHLSKIGDPMGTVTVLFHLAGLGGLISLAFTGAGAGALEG